MSDDIATAKPWGLEVVERPSPFLCWPTKKLVGWVSGWGYRKNKDGKTVRFHNGADLATPHGTELYAPLEGRVLRVGEEKGRGLFVVLEHPGGLRSGWWHLSKQEVIEGDVVATHHGAMPFALTGNSGAIRAEVTTERPFAGSHVHVALRTLRQTKKNAKPRWVTVDPAMLFHPDDVLHARALWASRFC